MASDFLPRKDAALLSWSSNFNSIVATDFASLGLSSSDATNYTSKHNAFASALTTSTEPNTRTRPAILATRAAKKDLSDLARFLSKKIQGTSTVTDATKASLGLDVKKSPAPILAPVDAPVAEIAEMNGWKTKIKTRPAGSEGRSTRATGAAMIHIYSFVGATPPGSVDDWKFEGVSSKAIFEVAFPSALEVGTRVWVCCQWVTARGLTSPACAPLGLVIGGGVPESVVG